MILKKAILLLSTLLLLHGGVKAQGVSEREPLFPRKDAATNVVGKPLTYSYLTFGKSKSGEQDVFFPMGENTGGHVFVGVDEDGRPVWVQAGAARKLSKALTGGVTIFAPYNSRQIITSQIKANLEKAGITLKFGATTDFHGNNKFQGIVAKGLRFRNLSSEVRTGASTKDVDFAVSLQKTEQPKWAIDAGLAKSKKEPISGRLRLATGRKSWYGAGAVEFRKGTKPVLTVSFGKVW